MKFKRQPRRGRPQLLRIAAVRCAENSLPKAAGRDRVSCHLCPKPVKDNVSPFAYLSKYLLHALAEPKSRLWLSPRRQAAEKQPAAKRLL